jgi:hypothetical protein
MQKAKFSIVSGHTVSHDILYMSGMTTVDMQISHGLYTVVHKAVAAVYNTFLQPNIIYDVAYFDEAEFDTPDEAYKFIVKLVTLVTASICFTEPDIIYGKLTCHL